MFASGGVSFLHSKSMISELRVAELELSGESGARDHGRISDDLLNFVVLYPFMIAGVCFVAAPLLYRSSSRLGTLISRGL